jgi:cytidine deaminase
MKRLTSEIREQLIAAATEARRNAYAPYSQFPVGAALVCNDGSIVAACNVENASLGLSICAERSAAVKAISEGKKDFLGIAIVAAPLATPCGACRQFLVEFSRQLEVIAMDADSGESRSWILSELLPEQFSLT